MAVLPGRVGRRLGGGGRRWVSNKLVNLSMQSFLLRSWVRKREE